MTVEGDTHVQSQVLEDIVQARKYREWLVHLALAHLGEDPVEIGSGLGHYAADWARQGVTRFTATEADPGRLQVLQQRFEGSPTVATRHLAVPLEETAAYTAVVAYNVLEHISDDVDALRAFARLLRPGGKIVILVPAFPSAMSRFDRVIGHQRRYRRKSLRETAEAAGLTVEVLHHVNSVGLLGWYLTVKALRARPSAGPLLWTFDRGVVPWLRRLEGWHPPPFGQSLFLVARVPAAHSGTVPSRDSWPSTSASP